MMNVSAYIDKCYERGFSAIFPCKEDKRGSLSGSAVGILVLLVTLMLISLLFATLQSQTQDKVTALNDANATASYNHIVSTGWSSIDLYSMVPYVAVFIVILGLLMGIARD